MKTLLQVLKLSLLRSSFSMIPFVLVGVFFHHVLGFQSILFEPGVVLMILLIIYFPYLSKELTDWYYHKDQTNCLGCSAVYYPPRDIDGSFEPEDLLCARCKFACSQKKKKDCYEK